MVSRLIHYCDRCANDNGLPIQSQKKVKSTCQICDRFIGPLNETVEDGHVPNDISAEILEVGSFKIQQMPGFLPGMSPNNIHPTLPYKVHSQDLVFYFPSIEDDPQGRKSFIVANPKKGEQFRVFIEGSRKSVNVGTIDASND